MAVKLDLETCQDGAADMLGMRIVLPSLAPLPLLHAPLPLLRAAHPLLCSASDPSRGPGWADEAAAAALVAGTAIGGGFLALPYTTAYATEGSNPRLADPREAE